MDDTLNVAIAVARQQYLELTKLLSVDDLRELNLGEGAKRKRVEVLLESLIKQLSTIDRELRAEAEVPIAQLGASHIKFFRECLEPNVKILRRAHWECLGLGEFFQVFDEIKTNSTIQSAKDAIGWGLERWREMLNKDELDEWRARGFAIDSAIEVIELPWFEPDRWLENMRLLRPVLLDRPPQNVRDHVRYRLTEIYRAFIFGLWMSSAALCRSLLEYSLKETAHKYGIERTKPGYRGEPEDKSLKELCEDFSEKLPSLSFELEQVRSSGNRIMHARKHDVVAYPKVLREEALESIRSMRQSLETIYSRSSG